MIAVSKPHVFEAFARVASLRDLTKYTTAKALLLMARRLAQGELRPEAF
jgi:hypothetical protein